MDAQHVARTSFFAGMQLAVLLVLLKENSSAAEYAVLARPIGTVTDAVNANLTDTAFALCPDLVGEIEADLSRYGRIL